MKNRGQITIFAILGLVILVIISIIIHFSLEKQPKTERVPFEQEKINLFITGCLDQALESGIAYCASGNQCPNYEEDLGGQVITSFLECTGSRGEKLQKQFPLYEIKVGNAGIDVVRLTKRIEAALSFPVIIKRAGKEHTIRSFRSQHYLEAEACIPCPECDENCILQGTEDLKVTILDLTMTFQPGEFVGLVRGECLAC